MAGRSLRLINLLLAAVMAAAAPVAEPGDTTQWPQLGRDSVLVWHTNLPEDSSDFVVRIADFWPDRYIEWESGATQGTILLANKAVTAGRGFINASLFVGGSDRKSRDATTLWLSQSVYSDLKASGKVKLRLDSIDGWMTLEGTGTFELEVNRTARSLPVIRVKDDRGSERWFLDSEENPLMVRHAIRNYVQLLVSITTDRQGTLRWIKGRKLNTPR